MSDIKRVFDNWASYPIEHEDYEKCGLCWKNKIRGDVAREFIAVGQNNQKDLNSFDKEVETRWKNTPLFKEVKGLLSLGHTIQEAEKIMSERGIEI